VEVERAPARVLNLGGLANPDVYVVELRGRPLVIKDYARRAGWVRVLIAPWLVRRELALLARAEGVRGVPRAVGRVHRLAFALEYVEGEPLRRRTLAQALPASFFGGLEAILQGLAARGLLYTDLRSTANVICTPAGTPALVDLGSALRFPVPARARGWLYGRALDKLRRRFEVGRPAAGSDGPPPITVDLHAGAMRIRLLDRGPVGDPVPVLALPDAGFGATYFIDLIEGAARRGRRALAIELPGFGGSRGSGDADPSPGVQADWLVQALELLRLPRVDVIAAGWAGLVARALAVRAPERVRALLTLGTPVCELRGRFRTAWSCALESPELLRAELRATLAERVRAELRGELEARLEIVPLRTLARAYATLPVSTDPARGREEVALEIPSIPWLALQVPADAELPRSGAVRTAIRPATPPEPEVLLEDLAAIASAVPGASVG
jgi:pimeloyl-ACP methyl ester carboxylesterase